jgi:hypothetical protein
MKSTITNCTDLVCTATAQAIALENKSQLLTIPIAGLAAGDSVTEGIGAIPLWRYARLTYVSISGTDPDSVSLRLDISGVTQGGPWLGGELAPTNANACAVFNCAEGFCMGPVESAELIVTNLAPAAVPAAATMVVRLTYEFPCQSNSVPPQSQKPGCDCGGAASPVFTPTPASGDSVVPTDPTGAPVQLEPGELVRDELGNLWGPDPNNPRMLCRFTTGRCRTVVIPSRQSDGTYKPIGGISCKQLCNGKPWP